MKGGTITGGTCGRTAPGVMVDTYATGDISGGTVDNVYVANNAKTMNASGTLVIGNLDLTSGALVNIGAMTQGAEVNVTANDGRFSTISAAAVDNAQYFKAAVDGKKVYTQDNALYMGNN